MTIVLTVNNGNEDFDFSIFINEIPFESNSPYYFVAILGNWSDEVDEFMSLSIEGLFEDIKKFFQMRNWRIVQLAKPIVSAKKPIDGVEEQVLQLIKEHRNPIDSK